MFWPVAKPKPRKRRTTKPGPQPDRLKIDLPIEEGLRRLVNAPPITKRDSRYATRPQGRRAAR